MGLTIIIPMHHSATMAITSTTPAELETGNLGSFILQQLEIVERRISFVKENIGEIELDEKESRS